MCNDQRIIYKYRLQDGGVTVIKGWFTRVVHVGEQDGELMIWMENSLTKGDAQGNQIPRDEPQIEVTIYVIGTGWPYSAGVGKHVGTVQMKNGLVWHVFISDVRWFNE